MLAALRRWKGSRITLAIVFLSLDSFSHASFAEDQEKVLTNIVETQPSEFQVGQDAPRFSLPKSLENVDSDAAISLENFKGKIILLNFWATWCTTCQEEISALERLQLLLGSDSFQVISINTDDSSSELTVKKFVERYGVSFLVLRDAKAEVAKSYNLTGFPESFFIGQDGKFLEIVDPSTRKPTVRIVGSRNWDSKQFIALIEESLLKNK